MKLEFILTEALNYNDMFKSLIDIVPEEEKKTLTKVLDRKINEYKTDLKKSDRIIWFLREYKKALLNNYLKDNEQPFKDKFKIYYDKEMSKFKNKELMDFRELTTFQNNIIHFLSLPIPEIQNYNFGNQTDTEIFDYFQKLEDKWKEGNKELIQYDEDDNVIIDLGDDYYWVSLDRSYCDKEGKSMGHCGNSPRSGEDDNIYSLRKLVKQGNKKYWHPFVTVTVDDEKMVWETKGRGNEKPVKRYVPYVVELFKNKNYISGIREGVGYKPENNLQFDRDFTKDQQDAIIKSNPRFDVVKREPFKFEYDQDGIANLIMDRDNFDDSEYLNRQPDEDEYDYYTEEAYENATYQVDDYKKLLEECYDIWLRRKDSSYYDEDDAFNDLTSFFSSPWGNPNERELAKEAIYDFYDDIEEEFDYSTDIEKPIESDYKNKQDYLEKLEEYKKEVKEFLKDNYQYQFALKLIDDFPYNFKFEDDISRTYKNPNQLEFDFDKVQESKVRWNKIC